MEAPAWKGSDKTGSLRMWIDELLEEVRKQFLMAGTHVEIIFIFGDEGLVEVVPIAGMEKDEIVLALRAMLVERDGYAYIHIVEAAARNLEDDSKSDSLLVIVESRDGLSEIWFNTVATQGEEKFLMDAVKVDGSKIDGRFVRMFEGL